MKTGSAPPLGGIINLYKPAGQSSFSLVAMARRALGVQKIGFEGTLDPFAEGILPLYIGRATAALTYAERSLQSRKTYLALLGFGASTDSQDATGQVLQAKPLSKADQALLKEGEMARIRAALDLLKCKKTQQIPAFSAAKIQGERFVDLVRRGESAPQREKQIEVYQAACLSCAELDADVSPDHVAWPFAPCPSVEQRRIQRLLAKDEYVFRHEANREMNERITTALAPLVWLRFEVSRGTYVRTLCQDLAKMLGFEGTTLRLIRERQGCFDLKSAILPSQFKVWAKEKAQRLLEEGRYDEVLLPPDCVLKTWPVLELSPKLALKLLQGKRVHLAELSQAWPEQEHSSEDFALVYTSGFFVGLARREAEQIRSERMFLGLEDFTSRL